MRFGGNRGSSNIEDRRGMGMVGGGLGIGGIVIALIAVFLGIDPTTVLNTVETARGPATTQSQQPKVGTPDDEMGRFVANVVGSTEQVWGEIFRGQRASYREPTLVLYTGATRSACGMGQSAMGPFYCPADEKMYIDLAFYNDLRTRFRAPGDFAQAYVIAHEVGHHVQKQLGIMQKMEQMRGRVSQGEYNQYSVRLELQADCFAGVWAHHANNAKLLDPGDVEEGLTAAAAVGDDRLQKSGQGRVAPDSFTHGSSAQRMRWFKRGMETGRMNDCDTFSTRVL